MICRSIELCLTFSPTGPAKILKKFPVSRSRVFDARSDKKGQAPVVDGGFGFQEGKMKMKHALAITLLTAGSMLAAVGCSSNNKKPAANASVTDIRSTGSTPPPPPPMIQPVQPAAPVQPVIADTSPVAVASATPAIAGNTYIIQKGDTLFKIARARYGDASAVKRIKEANPGLDANHIKVGQKINLP